MSHLISANYGEINDVGAALVASHKALNQMTIDLNDRLKKASWISESEASFAQIMTRYNTHMAELHNELNTLAGKLTGAGEILKVTDLDAAKRINGGAGGTLMA